MDFFERRMSVRYNGKISLEVKEGKGLTRDFSSSGIYFVTDQVLSVGERLEVVMLLEHIGMERVWRLHCEGKVLRVEPTVEKIGVAFAINSHKSVDSVRMAHA